MVASSDDAIRNSGRFLKEGHARAVKVEGGHGMAGTHKHKWIWVLKHQKETRVLYFGWHGFKRPQKVLEESELQRLELDIDSGADYPPL